MADQQSTDAASFDDPTEKVEAMIWALVDGQLDDDGVQQLEEQLKSDDSLLSRYIDCMQLEVGLREYFGRGEQSDPAAQQVPAVLAHLASPPLADLGVTPPVMG